jgi:anthranilate/para-aminobenzoate synthase component I
MSTLTLEEYQSLAKLYDRVAVFKTISADRFTPVGIAESLENEMQNGVMLESGLQQDSTGRYSLITFNPFAEISANYHRVVQRVGETISTYTENPFIVLRQLTKKLYCAGKTHAAIGFISYEATRLFEDIPCSHSEENNFPPDFQIFVPEKISFQ